MEPAAIIFIILALLTALYAAVAPGPRAIVASIARPSEPSPAAPGDGQITPRFRWIFITVTAITILCLVLAVVLGVTNRNASDTDPLLATIDNLWVIANAGVGAIFGLLAGKST